MFEPIEALDIYNKNVNVLIGSGASADLFPTLGLQIKDALGNWETIETLSTKYALRPEKNAALFMHYYNTCIYPVQTFSPSAITTVDGLENLHNYEVFLRTLLGFFGQKKGRQSQDQYFHYQL